MGSETYTVSCPAAMERLVGFPARIAHRHEATDGRYADSFGTKMQDLKDKHRWGLAGTALREWEDTLCPSLNEIVENNKKDIRKGESITDIHIIYPCYMLGIDKEHANPTIVVACDGKNFKGILKRTMRVILRSTEFTEKGFKVIGARIPDLDFKASFEDFSAKIVSLADDEMRTGPISLCGRQILATSTQREATIGGTIIVDDSYYALTVAHPFIRTDHTNRTSCPNQEIELFSSDWALENDDEEEYADSAYGSEQGFSDLGTSQSVLITEPAIRVIPPSSPPTRDTPHSESFATELDRSHRLRVQHAGIPMDWALMRLDNHRFFGMNEVQLPANGDSNERTWMFLHSKKSEPPEGEVVIIDRESNTISNAIGTSCTGKLQHSDSDITLWTLRTPEPLPTGICGSWVVDRESYEILGPIVAGSEILQETFLIPLVAIVENIRTELDAHQVRLPTKMDSLWLAVFFNNTEVVQRLLKTPSIAIDSPPKVPVQNAEFNQLKKEQMTMLHWSARQGYLEICEMLVRAGADINAKTTSLKTPLHLASLLEAKKTSPDIEREQRGKKSIVDFLLRQKNIEVNAKDQDGNPDQVITQGSEFKAAQEVLERHPESNEFPERFYYPSPSETNVDDAEDYQQATDRDPDDSTTSTSSGSEYLPANHWRTTQNHNPGWTWHKEVRDYCRQQWDGENLNILWFRQQISPPQQVTRRTEIDSGQLGGVIQGETIPGNPVAEQGDTSHLSPSYVVQPHPGRFFRPGRMFSALVSEPLGGTTVGLDTENISTVKFGETVHSNIRQFIVVNDGKGAFCYACPVSTYGGHGTRDPELDPRTHAIVYTMDSTPQHVPGESRLEKTPIPVVVANETERLQISSRIDYAIYYPIRYDVKVKNVGTVHPDYIPILKHNAKMESGW